MPRGSRDPPEPTTQHIRSPGEREQRLWHVEAEYPGRLGIDDQLERHDQDLTARRIFLCFR
jgi:hypothetical protein